MGDPGRSEKLPVRSVQAILRQFVESPTIVVAQRDPNSLYEVLPVLMIVNMLKEHVPYSWSARKFQVLFVLVKYPTCIVKGYHLAATNVP